MTISIKLPEDTERRLSETARRLNVRVEDLAAAAVRDLVAPLDEDFKMAAQRVLEKNRDLYRRLA
jgi:predicted transcriptional regulator